MKKRIFAGIMAFLMIFTLLSPVEAKAEENYSVSITLPEGMESVELTDEAPKAYFDGITLTIEGYEGEIVEAIVHYMNEDFEGYGIWFYPTEEGTFETDVIFDVELEGTYTLVSVELYTADYEEIIIDTNLPESTFTVVNHVSDREEPVITDIQMEGCGETFVQGQGETVTITAKVSDEGLGIIEDSVVVIIEAPNGETYSKIMVKQADDTYAAIIYIDGEEEEGPLYSTDWRVWNISADDFAGNYVSYYPKDDAIDLYFYVEDEDGYCDKAREDILLSFYDENYDLIDEFHGSSDDRTATLEELLGFVPEYETDLGFEGWRIDGTDIVLQNDTEFYIPDSGCRFDFVPATTIKQVEVDIWCLDENGEMHWTGYEPYVIPDGTTYAELLEMLPTPESVNGCNFVGWKYSDSEIDLSEEVDMDYVDVEAIYDKMFVTVSMDYITEEGIFGNDVKTLAVEEGTTYGELLELVEVPEKFDGCNFLGWKYSGYEGSLDDAVAADGWLSLSAEYDHYPVTIMAVYIGDDGEVVFEDTTEIYPAGTLMQDIRDEKIAKLNEVAADVAEWYVVTIEEEISILNFNLLMFAQYEDRVVVTYEPSFFADAGEYGIFRLTDRFGVLDKDECTEDNIISYFENEIVSELSLYKDITVAQWNYECGDLNEDGYLDFVMAYPDYEYNTPVIYAQGDGMMIYAVEAGQTISLPTEIEGYYVTWEDGEGNVYTGSYTVPNDLVAGDEMYLFAVSGELVEDEDDPTVNPEDPDQPEAPTNPEDPEVPNSPEDSEGSVGSGNKDEADKPADSEKPDQSSKPGTTAPETSDGTNGVPFMAVLLMGVASIMLAFKKRQTI